MILDLVNVCTDPGLANILYILKRMLSLIQIFGPLIALIFLAVFFVRLMINPDNKKIKKVIKNWLIALLFLFAVPIIVNAVMGLLDDSFEFSRCWNYAEESRPTGDAEFISDNDKDNDGKNDNTTGIISNPDDYDAGGTE